MTRPGLHDLLALERLEDDLFRSAFPDPEASSLFGGLVAAQCLRAAAQTVPADRPPHSMHGYFLRAGDPARPVLLTVDRDRDGRSFTARRVTAAQGGKVIFNLSASFQAPEAGPDVQVDAMPVRTGPELLPTLARVADFLPTLDIRVPVQETHPPWGWIRTHEPLGDDPLLHAQVLAYISDALVGLGELPEAAGIAHYTSLDHSVWFHRPVRLDDWVLLDLAPESVSGGRGLYSGRMFNRSGSLVATLMQECLFRPPLPPGAGLRAPTPG